MTSNLGTADLRKANLGFSKTSEAVSYEKMKAKVQEALKAHFRPEFLNRIDDTIVFHELSKEEVVIMVDKMVRRLGEQLKGQGFTLQLTPEAKVLLADKGYDPTMGARPLRRAIQRMLEDPLSEKLLLKEFSPNQTIVVDVVEGEISFTAVDAIIEEPPADEPPSVEEVVVAPTE
jgi:ATP-dependent Clp protease ATP-binding subunit ClpC